MSASEMEMSSEDERSRDSRSPTPPQSAAVPMELYREQLALNKGLQEELAKLNRTIAELRKELHDLREEQTVGKRRKKAKISTTSSSSSDEDEPLPTPPTQRPAQVPRAPQAPARAPQAPVRASQAPPRAPEAPQDNRRPDGMDTTPTPPATPGTSAEPKEAPKEPRIPPVILRKKERWTAVSQLLRTRGINFTKAKLINDGIAITAATILDYRKMTALFNTQGEEYHTYTLAEDRQLRVVIRGLPSGIPDQEIQEDLREQGFPEARVNRMTSRRTRELMPLVLVQVPQEQTKILEVTRCCSLVVRVERQRVQQVATQCHRCQRFGHGQSRCTATPKCVKCGQEHDTTACKKSREEPAKCANCGGEHPASYRGCAKFPKPTRRTPAAAKKPAAKSQPTPPATTQAARPATSGVSYAQAAAGKKTTTATPASGGSRPGLTHPSMERVIAQFQEQMQQQMLQAFQTMISNMPSLLQV